MTTVAAFSVGEGAYAPFVLTWRESHLPTPQPVDPMVALEETVCYWEDWVAKCTYDGQWREAVVRSLLTLKTLTYAPTGGMVAAVTTSLPEALGGVRNWDYRYCWLRDATITLQSLMYSGYVDEARAWRHWLLRAIAGDPAQMQIMYGVAGERTLCGRPRILCADDALAGGGRAGDDSRNGPQAHPRQEWVGDQAGYRDQIPQGG
jgi:GH15 family glucan-1,4-alpha-glucosidase